MTATRNEWDGMSDNDKKLIRKSTAEFLIITDQAGEQSIDARDEGAPILRAWKRWRLE